MTRQTQMAVTIAAEIVKMLRDDWQRIPNVQTDRAATSFEKNVKGPGIAHAISVIEARFSLKA